MVVRRLRHWLVKRAVAVMRLVPSTKMHSPKALIYLKSRRYTCIQISALCYREIY